MALTQQSRMSDDGLNSIGCYCREILFVLGEGIDCSKELETQIRRRVSGEGILRPCIEMAMKEPKLLRVMVEAALASIDAELAMRKQSPALESIQG